MKYETIYKDYLDKEMNIIMKYLKESFIEYYGISNKDKIEEVINDLTIIYMIENKKAIEFNKIISELEASYNIVKSIVESGVPKFEEEKLIKLAFNEESLLELKKIVLSLSFNKICLSKKENDTSLNIILGQNKGLPKELYNNIIANDVKHTVLGYSITYPITTRVIAIRLPETGQIPIHVLIHEINHQLQKDILCIVKDYKVNKAITVKGTSNIDDDLVNEILNDYCSLDIMKIFLEKYNSILLDTTYDECYIYLDQLSGNAMKKTYNLLKDELKIRLINGNAQTIRYLIDVDDEYNYILLNMFYRKLLNKVSEYNTKKRILHIPPKNKKEIYKYTNDKYIIIKNNYKKYQTYTQNLNKLVNNMINNGKAKKLSISNKIIS